MQRSKSRWIGDRQFYRTALVVGVPLMFQQLITSSVNLVDNLMVGQLGNEALSGVAAVNRFTMIAIFAVNGLLAAAAIFIAQFWGAEDSERMKQTFRFSLLAAGLILIPFWLAEVLAPAPVSYTHLQIPALKERPLTEKRELIRYILETEQTKFKMPVRISESAYRLLEQHEFRHNIGELKNDIQVLSLIHI